MNATTTLTRSPLAPLFGAALVVAAVGGLVWTLTRMEQPPGRAPGEGGAVTAEVRGAPIRSRVEARQAEPGPGVQGTGTEPSEKKPTSAYEEVQFAQLSGFDYPKTGSMQVARDRARMDSAPKGEPAAPAEAAAPSKIPPEVRALDGRRVTITGFMNPIEFDHDGVKSFALTAIPGGCCYGAIPRLNEWIVVSMPEGQLADYAYYDPVTIFGELSVGELYDEGVVLSLYRMTPTQVDVGY